MSIEELRAQIKDYEPGKDYVFVSYSKADAERVYPFVIRLQQAGCNLWIDKQLRNSYGKDWQVEALGPLADKKCRAVLFMSSSNSLTSAPVLSELVYSQKGKKLIYNHAGKPLRIIPINVDRKWYPSREKDLYQFILVDLANDERKLSTSDYDCMKAVGLTDYCEGVDAISFAGEVAWAIWNEVLLPLGGTKITFASIEEVDTVKENIPDPCFLSKPSSVKKPVDAGSPEKKEQVHIPGKYTLAEVRGLFSDTERAKQFRAVRKGLPRGGAGAMDYAMAAILGGCNSTSPEYKFNYYLYAVANPDKADTSSSAFWTWASNARKIIGMEKSGFLPADFENEFTALDESLYLEDIRKKVSEGKTKAFAEIVPKKQDLVLQAIDEVGKFMQEVYCEKKAADSAEAPNKQAESQPEEKPVKRRGRPPKITKAAEPEPVSRKETSKKAETAEWTSAASADISLPGSISLPVADPGSYREYAVYHKGTRTGSYDAYVFAPNKAEIARLQQKKITKIECWILKGSVISKTEGNHCSAPVGVRAKLLKNGNILKADYRCESLGAALGIITGQSISGPAVLPTWDVISVMDK